MACPLCGSADLSPLRHGTGKEYLRCAGCALVHLHPRHRPAPEEEHAHYRLHENAPSDAGYRAFLNRLAAPLLGRLPPAAEGLDYGAGPGPTLSVMLEEAGHRAAVYDPFFAPDARALERTYDFVTCTEAVEHFHAPRAEWMRLDRLLRPGGWLGVMTEFRLPETDFAAWWYPRDPTHVCFYAEGTLRWIARWRGWEVEIPRKNVALFRKPE